MSTLSLFLISAIQLHPFHASVCEIEWNENSRSLEITYRMFLDDLEAAINTKYEADIDIMKADQKDKVDEKVDQYLTEQFRFWVNGEKTEFEYLGSELEDYALWCFIEITEIETLETLEVDNQVMLELFDDQINLVHFNKDDKVRSLKLFKDNSYGVLELKELFE